MQNRPNSPCTCRKVLFKVTAVGERDKGLHDQRIGRVQLYSVFLLGRRFLALRRQRRHRTCFSRACVGGSSLLPIFVTFVYSEQLLMRGGTLC